MKSYVTKLFSTRDTDFPRSFNDWLEANKLNLDDTTVEVTFNVWGANIPATRLQPAEEIEIEIDGVRFLKDEGTEDERFNILPNELYDQILDWFSRGESDTLNTAVDSEITSHEPDEPDEDEVRYYKHGIEY